MVRRSGGGRFSFGAAACVVATVLSVGSTKAGELARVESTEGREGVRAQLARLPESALPFALAGSSIGLEKRRFKHPEVHGDDESPSRASLSGTGRYAHSFFEAGFFAGTASPVLAPGISGTGATFGVRIADNDLILGRLFFVVLGAVAQTQTHVHTGTGYEYDGNGGYWRIDTYRPLTGAEIAERDRAISDAIAGRYVGEFVLYFGGGGGSPDKDGANTATPGAKGWEYRIGDTPLVSESDVPIITQFGMVLAHASIIDAHFRGGAGYGAPANGAAWNGDLYYSNIGVYMRAIVPITRYFEAMVNWDLNILQLMWNDEIKAKGYRWTSPLSASLALNLSDHVYLKNEWILSGLNADSIGWSVHFGGRI